MGYATAQVYLFWIVVVHSKQPGIARCSLHNIFKSRPSIPIRSLLHLVSNSRWNGERNRGTYTQSIEDTRVNHDHKKDEQYDNQRYHDVAQYFHGCLYLLEKFLAEFSLSYASTGRHPADTRGRNAVPSCACANLPPVSDPILGTRHWT